MTPIYSWSFEVQGTTSCRLRIRHSSIHSMTGDLRRCRERKQTFIYPPPPLHHTLSWLLYLHFKPVINQAGVALPNSKERALRPGAVVWPAPGHRAWKSQIKAHSPQSPATPASSLCLSKRQVWPAQTERRLWGEAENNQDNLKVGVGEGGQFYCNLGWISFFFKSPLIWYQAILIN